MHLTEEQIGALRKLSAERHESISDLIRQSVSLFLAQADATARGTRIGRALSVAGRFGSGHSEISRHHDQYVADAFAGEVGE